MRVSSGLGLVEVALAVDSEESATLGGKAVEGSLATSGSDPCDEPGTRSPTAISGTGAGSPRTGDEGTKRCRSRGRSVFAPLARSRGLLRGILPTAVRGGTGSADVSPTAVVAGLTGTRIWLWDSVATLCDGSDRTERIGVRSSRARSSRHVTSPRPMTARPVAVM
jgi:hypothetical protein